MSKLKIIKASAGSGKTFRITFEYVKILLSNPESFQNILAVTFTNKATAEMKKRIVEELRTLSSDPEKSPMLEQFQTDLKLSADQIKDRATMALDLILHNYAHFSISTIDHFFQRLIRSLVHELGMSGGFRLELDQNDIVEQSVRKFLQQLSSNKADIELLLQFIDYRIEENKSWNVQWLLNDFCKELFKEDVRSFFIKNIDNLPDVKDNYLIRQNLEKQIKDFKDKAKHVAESIRSYMQQNNLSEASFYGKSKNPLFSLLRNIDQHKYEKFEDFLKSVEKNADKLWGEEVVAYSSDLWQFVGDVDELFNKEYQIYLTANAVYKNVFLQNLAVRLMNVISEHTAEKGVFLVSDAPILLQMFTENTDAPFIYEKIGHWYKTYMIDEFQDTSKLQWSNFKPLVNEALASGSSDSLIVGDVKQAIYRWRNGDWSILHKQVENDIANSETIILDNNWRSSKNIIDFNNTFFKTLTSYLDETYDLNGEISRMYSDVIQVYPDQKDDTDSGYVQIKPVIAKKTEDFIDEALIMLKREVDNLVVEYGVNLSDICILARKNQEIKLITQFLGDDYSILSPGALTLESSKAVQFIMTFIKWLLEEDDFYKVVLRKLLFESNGDNVNDEFFRLSDNGEESKIFEPVTDRYSQIGTLGLIGQLDDDYRLTEIFKNEQQFFALFYNEVKKISFNENPSLVQLLEWWENKGSKITLSVSGAGIDAITVLSAHKSKGLQFKHVIIPFAQWQWNRVHKENLWIEAKEFELNGLKKGIYPVNLSQKHINSPLASHFLNEQMAELADSLNILYVGFTRAVDSLTVFYQDVKHSLFVSPWIKETLAKASWKDDTPVESGEDGFKYGEPCKESPQNDSYSLEANHFQLKSLKYTGKVKIKRSVPVLSDIDINRLESSRFTGILFHRIFENIRDEGDIDNAIRKEISKGNINKKNGQNVRILIRQWLQSPQISQWFAPGVTIRNEATIIDNSNNQYRPDRIVFFDDRVSVVDYKFGEQQHKKHLEQVRFYCHLLQGCGYKKVEGFVWYPFLNKVDSV